MNEEDTFKALKKVPFNQIKVDYTMDSTQCLADQGWTVEEWMEAYKQKCGGKLPSTRNTYIT